MGAKGSSNYLSFFTERVTDPHSIYTRKDDTYGQNVSTITHPLLQYYRMRYVFHVFTGLRPFLRTFGGEFGCPVITARQHF